MKRTLIAAVIVAALVGCSGKKANDACAAMIARQTADEDAVNQAPPGNDNASIAAANALIEKANKDRAEAVAAGCDVSNI